MNTLNPKVDRYLEKSDKWQEELEKLRAILLDCGIDRRIQVGLPFLQVSGK